VFRILSSAVVSLGPDRSGNHASSPAGGLFACVLFPVSLSDPKVPDEIGRLGGAIAEYKIASRVEIMYISIAAADQRP